VAGEDPYRHPGGRTCASVALFLLSAVTAGTGLLAGVLWAAIR
jgi:hypothetical protein